MDIRSLEIFCEVIRRKGFSAAAKKLSLTQSAVSQQVGSLERRLGVSLLDPEDRRSPTPAGEYLYSEGNILLSQLKDIEQGVLSAAGVASGTVRFGMIDVAAISLMPRVLKKFRTKNPKVELEAVVKATGELIDMVSMGELDFAIAVTNNLSEDLRASKVYSDSIVAVVDKNSKFRSKSISIEELKGEPLILYPQSSHSRMIIENAFRRAGVIPTVNMDMHYPAAICSLVEQGMGVGLISELSAHENKMRGQRVISIEGLRSIREIGVTYRGSRRLSPQARALIEMVENNVGRAVKAL